MKALTVSSLVHGVRVLTSAVRDWRWGAVLVRLLVGGLGLVVLGVLGRSALARDVLSSSLAAGDAGATSPPSSSVAPSAPASIAPPPASASPSEGSAVAAVAASASSSAPGGPAAPAVRARATPDDPVYLNVATLADLHRLPGVGPKRAEAILALRAKLGHFRQIEDLLKVKGIGRSSLRKLRPLVRLDPPPSPAVADAGGPTPPG